MTRVATAIQRLAFLAAQVVRRWVGVTFTSRAHGTAVLQVARAANKHSNTYAKPVKHLQCYYLPFLTDPIPGVLTADGQILNLNFS